MKWIIECYGRRAGVPLYEPNHNLLQLWQACKTILEYSGESKAEKVTNALVEKIVKEFHELDKRSVSFRYSTDRDGKVIELPEGLVDLRNVMNVMTGSEHFFSGADGWLDNLASYDEDQDYDGDYY